MHLPTSAARLRHVNAVTHDGKVVLLATADGGKIWYTVKQDGFEDSYLNTPAAERTGWEEWRELPLPGARATAVDHYHDEPDQSVIDKEYADLRYTDRRGRSNMFHRSRYDTATAGVEAPVQLISGMGHLYVFRHSKRGSVLVDRFVLDGVTNVLVRKLEVRFKRSRQRYTPSGAMKRGEKGLSNIDSLDFRDIDGVPFFEPTTELGLIELKENRVRDDNDLGWFSVVLVPTSVHDQYHWHFFAYDPGARSIVLTSIRASDDGLFDVRDRVGLDAEARASGVRPWGIVQRELQLQTRGEKGEPDYDIGVANGFSAVKYDVQVARKTGSGDETQLQRAQTRVMLSVPVTGGSTATVSFAVAADGSLSRVQDKPTGTSKPLRSDFHELMLPLDTLEKVRAWARPDPPPGGPITQFARDGDDQVVLSTGSDTAHVQVGDLIKIEGTTGFDRYVKSAELVGVGFTVGERDLVDRWTRPSARRGNQAPH